MRRIGEWIDVVTQKPGDEDNLARVAAEVKEVCSRYPAPGIRV